MIISKYIVHTISAAYWFYFLFMEYQRRITKTTNYIINCDFTAHFIEWMRLMKPLFENDYQYKTDESKRPKKSKKSVSTSFKSLEID